jgi:hypothetical protein
MIRKYVDVRNITDKSIVIHDKRFSHGELTIEAGQDYGLPDPVWMDHRRKFIGRLMEISQLPPVVETNSFTPTHIFRDEPVMLTSATEKRAYFVKADGTDSWATAKAWAEAQTIMVGESVADHLEETTESEAQNDENA